MKYRGNKGILENLFYMIYLKMDKEKCKLEEQLNLVLDEVLDCQYSNFEIGSLLFLLGEYIRKFGDATILKSREKEIEELINIYDFKFAKNEENVLDSSLVQVNTSSLGAIYGGLRSINNYLKRDDISLNIKEIRKYTFDNVLDGVSLSNGNIQKEISFDIILACLPFGLFEPEDLVLVESIKVLSDKSKDTRDNFSLLLLAYYYTEQGSYHLAKELLKKVKGIGIKENKDTLLFNIIYKKLEDKSQLQENMIIHRPYGNNNIYEPGYDERFPKKVKASEEVILKAVTWPINEEMEVFVDVKVNGEDKGSYKGTYVESPQKHFCWDIGSYNEWDNVEYKFFFNTEENELIKSQNFSFDVLKEVKVSKINEVILQGTVAEVICINEYNNDFGELYIEFKENGDFVIDINETKAESKRDESLVNLIEDNECYLFKWNESELKISKEDVNFIYKKNSEIIRFKTFSKWIDRNNTTKFININMQSYDEEKFYGFGERYNNLNQKGNSPDVYVYNQYKEQGLKTYIPIPFYISSNNYGLFVETSNYVKFDMGETNEDVSIMGEVQSLKIHVMAGEIGEVIEKYTDITGKPKLLPKWAFGPWMSSNNWDSQKEVLKQLDLTLKHNIPSTVLVIEAWSDEVTYYAFNDAKYKEKPSEEAYSYDDYEFPEWGRWPNPKEMVERLHNEGLKCILWQIPILKQMGSINHIQKELDESYAIQNDFVIKNPDDTPYRMPEGWFKDSLLLDFSNEEGVNWWFNKRRYLVDDIKVDGFKTDGGEFLFGQGLKAWDGRTGEQLRNDYPNDYISAYYNFINEANPEGGITFSRAGFTGAQNFPAHWAGDERSNFEAFERSLYAGLSSGISGIPFWGWDLAGFSGDIPTAELFIRATEMATFCPIMQYHAESKAEFNQDRTPWNIAERTGDIRALDYYRYYANLRMNLIPYIYNEAMKCSETGVPLMRAMIIDYYEDDKTHLLDTQYMFGESLLVAPIIKEGDTRREIYFPEGKWYNFFSNEVFYGGKNIEVIAGLKDIPVYIKDNSVVSVNLNKEFGLGEYISNDITNYNNLSFIIVGDNIDYIFQDDLGNNFRFKSKDGEINIETNFKEDFNLLCSTNVLRINGEELNSKKKIGDRYIFTIERDNS
ncbi:glycoside hydrolase family 31 protein [Clostridium sediminicola]|uniref:glycoside hydrolase family 31 protein n=1 Tax=Clostridium sediminicola TaxID=3114879 RepID=UPI0031F22230